MKINFKNRVSSGLAAFTLVELLVVISIIAVLAAMTFTVMGGVFKNKKISQARAEMQGIESALEDYKAKYGVYPPSNPNSAVTNQLYYELTGVTNVLINNQPDFQTLDAASQITVANFSAVFGVGGVVNYSHGSSEDAVAARDFLPSLKATQITPININNFSVNVLATSVGGPDQSYLLNTLKLSGNPFRYVYPGTNNPNSYDLWVQLSINSSPSNPKMYLICNWNDQAQLNAPLP